MTDSNLPATANAENCPTCGNSLVSPRAACPRCNAKPGTATAAEPGLSETAAKGAFTGGFGGKRIPVDSPYPSFPERQKLDPASNGKAFRRLKLAAIAGVALIFLAAGVSYFHQGSPSYSRETKRPTAPIVPNSSSTTALQGNINSPVSVKKIPLDRLGTIDAARSAMVRGELSAARRQLALLPPGQEQRTDVRHVTDQLSQREHERDAALGLARACEKAGDSPCVLRAAGDALASDVSDSEAREMLLRAVAQTGSTPVASIGTNQRADPPRVTHRRVPQRHNVRRESPAIADDTYARP